MLDAILFETGDIQNFILHLNRGDVGSVLAVVSDTNSIQNAQVLNLPVRSGLGEIVYTF